jgi:hypothetical protein
VNEKLPHHHRRAGGQFSQQVFQARREGIGEQSGAPRRAQHLGLQAALAAGQVHHGRERADVGLHAGGVEHHGERRGAAEKVVLQMERHLRELDARRQSLRRRLPQRIGLRHGNAAAQASSAASAARRACSHRDVEFRDTSRRLRQGLHSPQMR